MSDKNNERREHSRREISLPIQIKLQGYDQFLQQYVTDISAGGLFVATPTPYEVGDIVDIEFFVESQEKYFFKVRGRVTRQHATPRGMGIQFTEIEQGSQEMLSEILKRL